MTSRVLCRDCKWCVYDQRSPEYSRCRAPVKHSYITGQVLYGFCDQRRSWGECGERARLFEPKEGPVIDGESTRDVVPMIAAPKKKSWSWFR